MKALFIKKTLFIILISIFSCTTGGTVKKNETASIVENKEDFFIFFKDFCMIEEFQLNRIKFPLTDVYLSEDLNNTLTNYIKKSEWKYLAIKQFSNNTFEYYFDSFENQELPDKDEMVYSIIGIENGIQINYYFKRIKNKWYLVKVENLST